MHVQFDPTDLVHFLGSSLLKLVDDHQKAIIKAQQRDFVGTFLSQHAQNIGGLLLNVATLKTKLNGYAVRMLVRPAMESQFYLLAGINDPLFAISKLVYETEQVIAHEKKHGDPQAAHELEANMLREKAKYPNLEVKKWKIWQIAEKAGCKEIYDKEYGMLCNHIHCEFLSLDPSMKTTRGFLLYSAAYVGVNSLHGYYCYLNPDKRDYSKQERDKLVNAIKGMDYEGIFAAMDWEPMPQKKMRPLPPKGNVDLFH